MEKAIEVKEQEPTAVEGNEERVCPFALLFELETLSVAGRQATFDVLKSILGEQGVELTPTQFSRICIHPSPATYMAELLDAVGAKKLDPEKMAEDVNSGVAMYLASKEAKLNGFIDDVLKVSQKTGIPVGAVSALSDSAANALMERLGLKQRGIELFAFDAHSDAFPRADAWLKVAKAMSKSSRNCVALVSCMASCKSALSAGMRCIAVPDAFTSFQDFGGADTVLDDPGEISAEDLVAQAFPPLPDA